MSSPPIWMKQSQGFVHLWPRLSASRVWIASACVVAGLMSGAMASPDAGGSVASASAVPLAWAHRAGPDPVEGSWYQQSAFTPAGTLAPGPYLGVIYVKQGPTPNSFEGIVSSADGIQFAPERITGTSGCVHLGGNTIWEMLRVGPGRYLGSHQGFLANCLTEGWPVSWTLKGSDNQATLTWQVKNPHGTRGVWRVEFGRAPVVGRFAFRVDAPTDLRAADTAITYRLRKAANEYRLLGSGKLVGSPERPTAQGTMTYIHLRTLGADINLTLQLSGTPSITHLGAGRLQLRGLAIKVIKSDSKSYPAGSSGEIALERDSSPTREMDKVFVSLRGHRDSFTSGRYAFPDDDHAVKVVLTGELFD